MRMSAYRLLERHQRLDREIALENGKRLPDLFKLQRLKRLRLVLKDRLYAIARARNPLAL